MGLAAGELAAWGLWGQWTSGGFTALKSKSRGGKLKKVKAKARVKKSGMAHSRCAVRTCTEPWAMP